MRSSGLHKKILDSHEQPLSGQTNQVRHMADTSSKITGQKEVQRNIARLRQVHPKFTRNAVNEAALNIQSQAKRNITDAPAVDTGQLRSSVKAEVFSDGFAQRIGSKVAHAKFVEYGTGPHFPPLDPIREWARRQGLPPEAAYPIALAISRRGTPAKPWLWPAFEQERPKFNNLIREAWRRTVGELG